MFLVLKKCYLVETEQSQFQDTMPVNTANSKTDDVLVIFKLKTGLFGQFFLKGVSQAYLVKPVRSRAQFFTSQVILNKSQITHNYNVF